MSNQSHEQSFVKSVTDATFETEVIDASRRQPVVVDFWATWCGPCRALGPILEKLAAEYAGRFILAKAETEQASHAAGQFGVSSIPAVFGVVNGEVVDGFIGALPERQLRDWLDRLLQSADSQSLLGLATTDPKAAEGRLRDWIAKSPNDPQPRVALARALMGLGRDQECRAVIVELERLGFMDTEAETLRATLDLRGKKSDNLDELRQQSAAKPADFELQLRFAQALAAAQQYEESLESLLRIVQKQKKGVGEQARAAMIDVFRVLGDSPLVSDYRRKLSMALY